MERLTEHHVNKTLGAYMVCSGACIDDNFDCNGCKKLEEMVDRLAAYEDTGLEPDEIDSVFIHDVIEENKRLKRLAQAEKDGRLVVLQDDITVHDLQNEYCTARYMADERLPSPSYTTGHIAGFGEGAIHILDKILTREEAEEALKKREADNEPD